jgi:hypothetical protein
LQQEPWEDGMIDDRQHLGEPDTGRIATGEDHEVRHVANGTGLSPAEVQELIAEVASDRNKLMAAALRKSSR